MLSQAYDEIILRQQRHVPVTYMLCGSTVYLVAVTREPIVSDARKLCWLGVEMTVKFATTLPEENPLISTLTCPESHRALISGDRHL